MAFGRISDRAKPLPRKRADMREANRRRGCKRSRAAGQGFARSNGRMLTHRMHSVRIGRECGMSTTPGPPAKRARAHRSIAQGFESRRRPDVHTSISPRFDRMATLTIEIHSKTSRCRREISTSPDSCPAATTIALTGRCTDLRVDSTARYPHRRPPVRRPGAALRSPRQCKRKFGGRVPRAGSTRMGVPAPAVARRWRSSVPALAQPNEAQVCVGDRHHQTLKTL